MCITSRDLGVTHFTFFISWWLVLFHFSTHAEVFVSSPISMKNKPNWNWCQFEKGFVSMGFKTPHHYIKKNCNGKNVRFFESAFDKNTFWWKDVHWICMQVDMKFFLWKGIWSCFPNAFNTLTSHTILISNVFWVLPYNEPPTIFSMKINWQIKIKKWITYNPCKQFVK